MFLEIYFHRDMKESGVAVPDVSVFYCGRDVRSETAIALREMAWEIKQSERRNG